MGGVGVAAVLIATALHPAPGGVAAMAIGGNAKGVAQVVYIGSFTVGDISEQPLAVHFECG